MTQIEIDGLRKSHGPVEVLHGLDLAVPSGTLVAVLGPSGCGKTTLLRCLAGLETIQGGTIRLGGRVVAADEVHVPPEDRDLAMVFQSYALWPHMNVTENVGYALRVARAADRATRMSDALETVGLTPYAARHPAELSGGQQQRTALARALVAEPGLILMDEPLANLDMHLREEMRAEFRRLHRQTGATMVIVTHDQADALSLADLVVVMEAGRILQAAPPSEVYARPASRSVARLIGRSAIVEAEGGRWRGLALPGAEGHDGAVAIRPEDVVVEPGDMARVVEAVYLGDRWRLALDLGGSRLEAYMTTPPETATVEVRIGRAWPMTG